MSTYKPLSTDRSDVVTAKQNYGIWFGAVLGFIFAAFAWGIDAYQLSQINSLYPWIKVACGVILCSTIGGLAGWLAAKFDKPIIALPIWIVAALLFAWLTIMIPLQLAPRLLTLIEPEIKGLLHYEYYPEFAARIGVAFTWIVILVAIAGLLQLPLSEGAVFSTSIVGKVAPMLVTLVLMGIAGTIIDGLNNELLRTPMQALDASIQFYVDHQTQDVDPADSRKMHQGALRMIKDSVSPRRQLTVSGYDAFLTEVDVLVRFDNGWVECQVFYGQPANCRPAIAEP
jgi:hypothetical protein